YVHRIGRTARAGQDGHAVSLVCIDEHQLLKDIERLLKKPIEKKIVPGYEPDPRVRAEPLEAGQRKRGGGSQARGRMPGRGGQPQLHTGGQRRSPARKRRAG
ncbi:MAG: hypothetical protein ACRES3_12105, partial [Steroidobacteraceae bacterium]